MKAFCVVIGKPLIVARCPLQPGSCAWQHRQTNFCKYTDRDLSVQELAVLVGSKPPAAGDAQALEVKLLETIRANI